MFDVEPAQAENLKYVVFTRYHVAHSNNDGAVIACVDWAPACGRSDIAYSERFLTSIQADDVKGINTLGAVKNMLNAAVVRRVTDRSLAYSAGGPDPATIAVPHTYSTMQEAAAPLPERLTSLLGLPSFSTKSMHREEDAPATSGIDDTALQACSASPYFLKCSSRACPIQSSCSMRPWPLYSFRAMFTRAMSVTSKAAICANV